MSILIDKDKAISAICKWAVKQETEGTLTMTMAELKQTIVDILEELTGEYVKMDLDGDIVNYHGRIIDADELVKVICADREVSSIHDLTYEEREIIKIIDKVPTLQKATTEYMMENYCLCMGGSNG